MKVPLPVDADAPVAGFHVGVHPLPERPLALTHPAHPERRLEHEVDLAEPEGVAPGHMLAQFARHEPPHVKVSLEQLIHAEERAQLVPAQHNQSARHRPQRKPVPAHPTLIGSNARGGGLARATQEERE